ncbi:unnamed protein product [Vitrella brassicaformis CCMP3155]|uniref:SSD domain-containing protein n=2 Tax=Vitrella brassicaformis TaxID=1169539 RepID=A0A0G4GTL8_VITBC|nr:unnamed protein product [Vitrella brassicaformis CCMP3155]|eukprot:CEM34095.1 unnamed protein product [Vitrella brassicaformis CCMP3155]
MYNGRWANKTAEERPLDWPNHDKYVLQQGINWPVDVFLKPRGTDNNGTTIDNVSAMLFRWSLRDDTSDMSSEKRAASMAWEQEFLDEAHHHWKDEFKKHNVSIYANARRSIDDELKASTTLGFAELIRLFLAGVIVFCYAAVANFSCDQSKTKTFPALMGCLAALLGFLLGSGLCYACGMKHVPPAEATPFLVLGVGVDDMFVIMNSYALAFQSSSPRERCQLAMKDCGISITITTLTNLIAFGVGAASPYYAIVNFCIITAVALAMGYVLTLTFFVAILCLDCRREATQPPQTFFLATYFDGCGLRCFSRKSTRDDSTRADTHRTSSTGHGSSSSSRRTSQTSTEAGAGEVALTFVNDEKASFTQPMHPVRRSASWQPAGVKRYPTRKEMSTFQLVAHQLRDQEKNIRRRRPREGEVHEETCWEWWFHTHLEDPSNPARRVPRGSRDVSDGKGGQRLPFKLWWEEDPNVTKYFEFEEPKGNVGRWSRKFFRSVWGRLITVPAFKVLVVLMWFGYLAISGWGDSNVTMGLNLLELTPFQSYYREFYDELLDRFDTYGEQVMVIFPEPHEWWRNEARENYKQLVQRINESDYVSKGPNNMLDPLRIFEEQGGPFGTKNPNLANYTNDPTLFMTDLKRFLGGTGRYLSTEFKFSGDNQTIESYRMTFFAKSGVNGLKLMEGSRDDCRKASEAKAGAIKCQAFGEYFIYYESDATILFDTFQNMGWALLAVLIVSIFLMHHWQCWVLVILMILSIDVGLFAFMKFWGLDLNMLTMVNLIISIGFSVDYTTHVCHTFAHATGPTKNHRANETLVLMGNAIFHGAISTFLAIVLIVTVDSFIFVVFFRMMTLVLCFGFLHGLIILPVILTFFGPLDNLETTLKGVPTSLSIQDALDREASPVEAGNSSYYHTDGNRLSPIEESPIDSNTVKEFKPHESTNRGPATTVHQMAPFTKSGVSDTSSIFNSGVANVFDTVNAFNTRQLVSFALAPPHTKTMREPSPGTRCGKRLTAATAQDTDNQSVWMSANSTAGNNGAGVQVVSRGATSAHAKLDRGFQTFQTAVSEVEEGSTPVLGSFYVLGGEIYHDCFPALPDQRTPFYAGKIPRFRTMKTGERDLGAAHNKAGGGLFLDRRLELMNGSRAAPAVEPEAIVTHDMATGPAAMASPMGGLSRQTSSLKAIKKRIRASTEAVVKEEIFLRSETGRLTRQSTQQTSHPMSPLSPLEREHSMARRNSFARKLSRQLSNFSRRLTRKQSIPPTKEAEREVSPVSQVSMPSPYPQMVTWPACWPVRGTDLRRPGWESEKGCTIPAVKVHNMSLEAVHKLVQMAQSPVSEWKFQSEKNGVVLELKTLPDSKDPVIRGRYTMRSPGLDIHEVKEVILDRNSVWRAQYEFWLYEASQHVAQVADETFLTYQIYKSSIPSDSRRVLCHITHAEMLSPHQCVVAAVDLKQHIPDDLLVTKKEKAVRAEILQGGHVISQSCDGTIDVVFVMQLDVKPFAWAPRAAVRAACANVYFEQAQQLYRIDNVLGDAREIMSQPPSPRNSDSDA